MLIRESWPCNKPSRFNPPNKLIHPINRLKPNIKKFQTALIIPTIPPHKLINPRRIPQYIKSRLHNKKIKIIDWLGFIND